MPKQIIYMMVVAMVMVLLGISFILICCVCASGKQNHKKEFDKSRRGTNEKN